MGHTVGGNKSWSIKNVYINMCVVIKESLRWKIGITGDQGSRTLVGGLLAKAQQPLHLQPTSRTLPRDLPDESHGGGLKKQAAAP